MSQIDKAHQTHRDGQADRYDEQKHRVSQTIKKNAYDNIQRRRHVPPTTQSAAAGSPQRRLLFSLDWPRRCRLLSAPPDLKSLALVLDLRDDAEHLDSKLAIGLAVDFLGALIL